jgi:hypothetical protein
VVVLDEIEKAHAEACRECKLWMKNYWGVYE